MALRFNLAALVKRARPTQRTLTLRTIEPTQVLRRELERRYMRLVRAIWTGCRERLMPAYGQALRTAKARAQQEAASPLILDDANDLAGVAGRLWEDLDHLVLELVPDIRLWAVQMEAWHRVAWSQALTPSGVQLHHLLAASDVADTVEGLVQTNAALIRSLSSEARSRVEGIVFRGFQQRLPARDIARQLAEAVGMSRARALRIAADQTAKLSAQLDTERMAQAGIDEFTWVHSGKVHYRPWHRERNGKRFKLQGDIKADDMPGIPPFCGCKKRAELTL